MYPLIPAAVKVDIDVTNATAMSVFTSTIMEQRCLTCGSQGHLPAPSPLGGAVVACGALGRMSGRGSVQPPCALLPL